jgi:thymidine kinase
MNSGKTTALIQVAYNYEERGMQALVMKPAIDTKGDDHVTSRLGVSRKVDILVHAHDSVAALLDGKRPQCVLIDEAQFLTPAQAEELFWYAVDADVPVIAYGIRSDFKTAGFPGSSRLLELAHELQELKTICQCGKKAVFNGRKVNGTFVAEGKQVAIDDQAAVEYQSLCAADYRRLVLDAKHSA